MKFRKLACCLLAAALVLPLSVPSYGASGKFKDTAGHWAENYINTAVSKKFASGYPDGRFLPDKAVTRAEFAAMINKALGNQAIANLTFVDVHRTEWYYDDVSKAVAAAYTGGYDDNTFRPDNPISRQEAAVMIARIVPYGGKGNLKSYSDNRSISDWAYESLEKVNGKGYVGAYNDGKIHPGDQLTRAQTAKIICDILKEESIATSNTTVKKDGTKLSGKIYTNNVTIDEDLDDGSASIENCTILGSLAVNGGGDSTITITNTRVADAIVDKDDDSVRVLAKGETAIVKLRASKAFVLQTSSLSGGLFGPGFIEVSVSGSSKGTLKGSFPKVSINGNKAELILSSGTINELTVGGRYSDITAANNTTIGNAVVNSESYFHGSGTISNMEVNAKGVTYETKPKRWTIASSANTPTRSDETAEISFSPKNGATKVKLDTKITITFGSTVKLYDGGSVTGSDIEDFVEIRKGSSSGSLVSFTASINSGKTVITLTPDKALSEDTKYYVLIPKNSVRSSDGSGNPAQSFSFTTGDSYGSVKTSFSPANGAVTVPVNTGITISFSDAVVRHSNGATINTNDSYLYDCIILKRNDSGGASVSFTATINSAKKVITITPKSELTLNQKYYIAIVGNRLKTKDGGETIPAASASWTTGYLSPALNSFSASAGETSITVTATPNIAGRIYTVALPAGSPAPSAAQIAAGQNNSGQPALAASKNENAAASTAVTLPVMNGFASGIPYDVWGTLYSGASGTYSVPVKQTVTTTLPTVSLNGLTVSPVVEGTIRSSELSFKSSTLNYTVSLNSSITAVELRAQSDPNAVITVTGIGTGTLNSTGSLTAMVGISSNPSLTITVTRPGSMPTSYTVALINANNTGLSSLRIDNMSQTTAGSSYTYALSTTGAAIISLNAAASDQYALFSDPTGTNVTVIEANKSLGSAAFKLALPEGSEPIAVEFEVISGSSPKPYYILFTRP